MDKPKIYRFNELESTNEYIKQHLDSLPDKAIVIANTQTKGRGRNQHIWVSANPDNLYFSFHLRLSNQAIASLPTLTHFLALVSANVLDIYLKGTPWKVQIKWPNDLFLSEYKMGGILAEAIWIHNRIAGIALGIGINLSISQDEKERINQPVSDLRSFSRSNLNKETIFQEIVQAFLDRVDQYLTDGFDSIREEYEKKMILQIGSKQYRLQDDGSVVVKEEGKKPYHLINPIDNGN
ncbi:biotin--[acetyl-CoA-carboxylase] ligase [bacterium]|nr:biotin--[acetyl-CoA-carboxylase] ligase [bacterium]